ncbi:MAG: phosphatidylglycerol lysyltransferase domain-containing protein [Acutalibacteraceae bacterium]|jgi:hypothetical protein|nr:DUF2156 domain-containing protein [Clostridiales bacterium]
MREFREPVICDKPKIKEILSKTRQTTCEFCFGNIFMWAPVYGAEISMCEHFFVCRSTDEKPSYSVPKGDGDFTKCIGALHEEALSQGNNLELYAITEQEKEELEILMPGKFSFIESRHNFDYVYSVEELATLSGKKFHSKRNHISYFEKNNNWSYEEINSNNMQECIEMNRKWEAQNIEKNPEGIGREEIAITRAFEHFEELELKGGAIRVDGEIIAYTMGERLNDNTFCTHIEKALSDVRGAYQIINREFARNTISEYEFVNREEDLGIEGLRKAKLSYNPVMLVKKYRAVFEG